MRDVAAHRKAAAIAVALKVAARAVIVVAPKVVAPVVHLDVPMERVSDPVETIHADVQAKAILKASPIQKAATLHRMLVKTAHQQVLVKEPDQKVAVLMAEDRKVVLKDVQSTAA
ncbi:MAG: hypothetical protein IPP57_04350 [Candidatus Obscuribacter sp.]|nr:hypothetical protein [Candidatus Obscuribacter sp.]